jgi:hypothetical protein
MISWRIHGQLYLLAFLLLIHLPLVFRICVFSFSGYKSTRKASFFIAFCVSVRCPWDDHTSTILRIVKNFLIVFPSVFCPFSLSSSAVLHHSLLIKKKNAFIQPYIHSYYFCLIYYLSLRCPTELHIIWHSQWAESCYVLCAFPSVSPSRCAAVSVFPTVDLLCQHSTSSSIFSSFTEWKG